MALNIKDPRTEALAVEAAALTGETESGAVQEALHERLDRLRREDAHDVRGAVVRRLLVEEIWPHVPVEVRDRPLGKVEEERVLGYGPEGV